MIIRIQNFLAEFPRVHPTRLNDYAAQVAQNIDISSSTLKPFYSVVDEVTLPALATDTKQAYLYRNNGAPFWLQFPAFVDVIGSPIKDDSRNRLYWSGDSRDANGDAVFTYTPYVSNAAAPFPSQWFKLGIPAPESPPVIASSTIPAVDVPTETRTYVYTYVNEIGEESAPSPPSALVTVPSEFATVALTGLVVSTAASTGRIIEKIRLYRSLASNTGGALFKLVTQFPVADTTYTDTKAGTELFEEIQTATWDAPRSDMKGLGLTAYGVAYGFTGKIVCMSYPFHIYAWPRNFELTTQFDIVAIGHYESNLIVATKGNPVMITGIDPIGGMSMIELPLNEACVSKRSMVSMGYAAVYASPNGLVMASSSGARLISTGFFGKDEWAALNPASIHAVEHRGRYLFFYDVADDNKGAYIFDPSNIERGIVKLSIWCISAFRDIATDTLYLLQADERLQRFDDVMAERVPYVWRSKRFTANVQRGVRMLAAQVLADSYDCLTFSVHGDDREIYRKTTLNNKPFRLPNHSNQTLWHIEISGTDVVREVCIAGSMQEISS